MTEGPDQYARWQAALDGNALDLGERGDPPSGFYRFAPWKSDPDKKQTTIAVWRGDGEPPEIFVEKNFHEPKTMTAMEADDLFTSQHVAITHELYESRRTKLQSAPWPEIHTTYLRSKDIQDGVVWTEEWSRQRLSANVETHDENGNRREAIGGNGPPADAPELSPVETLSARIKSVGELIAKRLKEIGGKPRDKKEADEIADYAVAFKKFETEGDTARKAEKEPHFQAGKAVDDKWRGPIETSQKSRAKVLAIAEEWLNADRIKRQAEADAATAAARLAAQRQEVKTGEKAEPVAETKVEAAKIGTGRTVSQRVKEAWKVKDYVVFTTYLVENDAIPPALADAFNVTATNLGKANIKAPGIETVEIRKAA